MALHSQALNSFSWCKWQNQEKKPSIRWSLCAIIWASCVRSGVIETYTWQKGCWKTNHEISTASGYWTNSSWNKDLHWRTLLSGEPSSMSDGCATDVDGASEWFDYKLVKQWFYTLKRCYTYEDNFFSSFNLSFLMSNLWKLKYQCNSTQQM